MSDATRVMFVTPLKGDVICRHCSSEIEAIGEYHTNPSMKGLRWFVWRHVKSGKLECTQVSAADPYDDWEATRRIEVSNHETG
jgi:hypothetical protein